MAVHHGLSSHVNEFLWLNTTANGDDDRKALQASLDGLQIFGELELCEQHIRSALPHDRLALIVSGDIGLSIVPRVHSLPQVLRVYILCGNREAHEEWIKTFTKVKGIFTDVKRLVGELEQQPVRGRPNLPAESISMSILNGSLNGGQSTSNLDGRFVHSQLLIDCLRRMETVDTDREELICSCRATYPDFEDFDKHSAEFRDTYSADRAIWWYTRESFVYRLLNRSLRKQDIDLLLCFRFLIRDIEQQLREYQCMKPVCLYRGQFLADDELEILKQSVGNLISMNSFLSTTVTRSTAVEFLTRNADRSRKPKSQAVIFEIHADPRQPGVKSFANVTSLSDFPDEEEVLMMIGSVFRLNSIDLTEQNIWNVRLTLCSDHDHDLKGVVDTMRDQYGQGQTRLLSFGHVLVDMARFDDAEKYYRQVLKKLAPDELDTSLCYHALAKVACEKAEYELSLKQLDSALDIAQRKLPQKHPRLGFIYTTMGEVSEKKRDLPRAKDAYERALQIWRGIDPQHVAWCLNNIGNVCSADGKHAEALQLHHQAMELKCSCLPASHPCVGNAHLNMGNVYFRMQEYDRALECYKRAKEVFTVSVPPHHPSMAIVWKNIAGAYEMQGNVSQALLLYKTALSIRQESLSPSHPDVLEVKGDVERVSTKLKL